MNRRDRITMDSHLDDLAEVAQLRREVMRDSLMTDQLAGELLRQVIALEEIVAARWPRSIGVRRRLARELRRSVARIEGRTFAEKRVNTIGSGWPP